MKWDNVFEKLTSVQPDEAKRFIETTKTDAFQLVDVRQPEEYMKQHLPGAALIPLNELVSGNPALDKKKPTLVYCSTGERSLAASQWFITEGFNDVRHIEGGIEAWFGSLAHGHDELNLNLINPDTVFPDAISMAFAMEEGLRQFYMDLARETENPDFQKLYRKLASFEVEHKTKLSNKYFISQGKELIQKEVEARHGQIMEGGGYADITLVKTLANAEDKKEVFSLALAFEIQAYDFYVRLSRFSVQSQVREFFLEMADEEKKHLAFITKEMDKYMASEKSP